VRGRLEKEHQITRSPEFPTTFHTKKYDRGAGGITCPWFWLRFVNYAEKQTPIAKPYKLFATARQRESGRLPPVNDDTG